MSEQEKLILIDLAKSTKSLAVRNQRYECAAVSRDLEKYLERGDVKNVSAEELYNEILDKYMTLDQNDLKHPEMIKALNEKFEISKNIIFRQLRRQKLLDELFKDSF